MPPKITGKCIIISAPSGAGKTTIVRRLLDDLPSLKFSISATSRERRHYEVDGGDYYFIGVEQFKKRIEQKDFIEWEEVYPDQFYGTLLEEINRIWESGNHVIFDVDVVGGLNLKSFFNEKALSVFIKPPSVKALENRLRSRGSEPEEKIAMRLGKANVELAKESEFDQVILNDDLNVAVENAFKVISAFLTS